MLNESRLNSLTKWLFASAVHLVMLTFAAALLAWGPGRWLLLPFTLVIAALEYLVRSTTPYRGEDWVQWPIILCNSLAYGAAFVCLQCTTRRRQTRT